VFGSAKYTNAAANLFHSAMFENRDDRNMLAGNICIAIAQRFITNGAMEKGKINAVNALSRETL